MKTFYRLIALLAVIAMILLALAPVASHYAFQVQNEYYQEQLENDKSQEIPITIDQSSSEKKGDETLPLQDDHQE